MKITHLTVLLMALCLTTLASPTSLEQIKPIDRLKFTNSVRTMSAAARGFISGYRKGMYRLIRYTIDRQCFDQRTQNLIVDSFDGWGTNNFDWGTKILSITTALNMITDFCEYDESLYDILAFCYDYEEACDPVNMM